MTIKVRCKACSAVLKYPDKAAGKTARCRECGERVRVPAGSAAPVKRKRPSADPESPDDFLGGLGSGSVEDSGRKVCPNCATPVRVDEVECPKCHVQISTGTLSAQARRKKERGGLPPEEFYSKLWGDCWDFVMRHKGLVIQTMFVWTICLTLSVCASHTWAWCVQGRYEVLKADLDTDENVTVSNNPAYILIRPTKETAAVYDGKRYTASMGTTIKYHPDIAKFLSPPAIFWAVMSFLFYLGFGGWAWLVATKIADVTMQGKKKIKRFNPDFFGNLTMGFRFIFWPVVVMLPFVWIPAAVSIVPPFIGAAEILAGIIFYIPILLFLPIAVVHMSQTYGYRGWLLYWLVKDFFRTLAPSLYLAALTFGLVILVPVGALIAIVVLGAMNFAKVLEAQQDALQWLATQVGDMGNGFFQFVLYQLPLTFTISFIIYFIICGLAAAPAIFMMRAYGLFGRYFRPDLSIVNEFPEATPAGFGPRFLAWLVDCVLLFAIALFGAVAGGLLGALVGVLYAFEEPMKTNMTSGLQGLVTLILWLMYFASAESGAAQASPGKWSLGLIVTTEDNEKITWKQAAGRALLGYFTGTLGFLPVIFRADRKSLADMAAKTKVVFQTDETQT